MDFSRGYDPLVADNTDCINYRTGYVVTYAGCPILWKSQLQMEIALLTAEAEYIAMSSALRETIPIMNLMPEVDFVFALHLPKPNFLVKVHKNNQRCIPMAQSPKFSARTKHIAIKYHHFRQHVESQSNPDRLLQILYIDTNDHLADILTKPLSEDKFLGFRKLLCGW